MKIFYELYYTTYKLYNFSYQAQNIGHRYVAYYLCSINLSKSWFSPDNCVIYLEILLFLLSKLDFLLVRNWISYKNVFQYEFLYSFNNFECRVHIIEDFTIVFLNTTNIYTHTHKHINIYRYTYFLLLYMLYLMDTHI